MYIVNKHYGQKLKGILPDTHEEHVNKQNLTTVNSEVRICSVMTDFKIY